MEDGFLLILIGVVGVIGLIIGFALGMGVASLRAGPPAAKKHAPRSAARPTARPAPQSPSQPVPQPAPQSAPQPVPQSAPRPSPAAAETVSPTAPAEPPAVITADAPLNPPQAVEVKPPEDFPLASDLQTGATRRTSLTPLNVISRALQADVRPPNPADRSIAVQVDEILQEMLKKSPLAARAIKLMELPGKGMVVMVGLNQYDGVDAVPDEDIRKLIRSAVAEWERQATQSAP